MIGGGVLRLVIGQGMAMVLAGTAAVREVEG
jgi:hypothetical protein